MFVKDSESDDSELDDSESDDSKAETLSLEAAVRKYPTTALRELSGRLLVKYNRMERRMTELELKAERLKAERQHLKRKRQLGSRGVERRREDDTVPSKFHKGDTERMAAEGLPKLHEGDVKRINTEERSLRLPLKDLIGSDSTKQSPESGTKIVWRVGSSSGGSPKQFRDVQNPLTYNAASQGSTIPNTDDGTGV